MPERVRLIAAGCPSPRLEQLTEIARQLNCDFLSASTVAELQACAVGSGCIVSELLIGSHNLLQSLPQLVQERPTFKVIVLSDNVDVSIAVRAMKAGAFNVLMQDTGATTLMLSIHDAIIASAEAASQARQEEDLLKVIREFNAGEAAVLRMVLAGQINKEIADKLGVSARTVELRRQKILHATGATNAVRLAYLISQFPRVWQYLNESQPEDPSDADTVPEMNVPGAQAP
jgi:two-component system response regulator FixJ